MTKNYVLKPIYNDENECINDTLSVLFGGMDVGMITLLSSRITKQPLMKKHSQEWGEKGYDHEKRPCIQSDMEGEKTSKEFMVQSLGSAVQG